MSSWTFGQSTVAEGSVCIVSFITLVKCSFIINYVIVVNWDLFSEFRTLDNIGNIWGPAGANFSKEWSNNGRLYRLFPCRSVSTSFVVR